MLNFEINIENLRKEITKISTWEDWHKIKHEIFKSDKWEQIDAETLEKDLERPMLVIDGYNWKATTNNYKISPNIFYLYERTRWEAFAKLEPESDADNKKHPEEYGKWCVYCKRWTREYPKSNCPRCGNELLYLALHE